jgi:Fe-S cluster biogenesis protein NfuA
MLLTLMYSLHKTYKINTACGGCPSTKFTSEIIEQNLMEYDIGVLH